MGIAVATTITGAQGLSTASTAMNDTALIAVLIVRASSAAVAIIVLGVIWFRNNYEIQFDRSKKKTKASKSKKGGNEDDDVKIK